MVKETSLKQKGSAMKESLRKANLTDKVKLLLMEGLSIREASKMVIIMGLENFTGITVTFIEENTRKAEGMGMES